MLSGETRLTCALEPIQIDLQNDLAKQLDLKKTEAEDLGGQLKRSQEEVQAKVQEVQDLTERVSCGQVECSMTVL
jgi:hypothetical protein